MNASFACPLISRAIISVAGADRRAFLQGLISNDIQLCQPGTPLYAALLTPQGKFLHDLFIVDHNDRFLIDAEAARIDDLLQRLRAYKLRSKVDLTDESVTFDIMAVWNHLGIDTILPVSPGLIISYTDPRRQELGLRLIMTKGAGITDVDSVDADAYDQHRLALGVPDGSRDMIVGQSTLLECNMDRLNAISWTKGCYIGQELTARMHYRNLGKKRLTPVTIEGDAPTSGAILTLNGEEAGEMRSHNGPLGLALLRTELENSTLKLIGSELHAD